MVYVICFELQMNVTYHSDRKPIVQVVTPPVGTVFIKGGIFSVDLNFFADEGAVLIDSLKILDCGGLRGQLFL